MFRPHRFALLSLCAASLSVLVSMAHAGEGFTELFNGKDLTGWKTILGNGKPDADGKVFFVKDGAIVVAGKPAGYFYTDKSYKNYVLKFDWKYIKDGNSGLLVHIQEPHKVWPKSLEIQGQQKSHGSIIGINTKVKFDVNKDAQKQAIKIGEWNTTEVRIVDGDATTSINGTQVSTVKILDDAVKQGPFGFQSEGTELHFKNIKIKVLP